MSSRSSEYRKNHPELVEKRKQKDKESQLQKLKDELAKTKEDNKNWFDPNRNPYLSPPHDSRKWNTEDEKQFYLQYHIDHFHEKEKGDRKKFYEAKKEAYRKYGLEMDLKHRIVKWRLFQKAIAARKNREPTYEECLFNNVICPDAIKKESPFYRPDLMYLTQIQADDPIIEITTSEDWALEDEIDYINGNWSPYVSD